MSAALYQPLETAPAMPAKLRLAGGRLVSLDVFRGFVMILMAAFNNPGSRSEFYAQLSHSPWHGWTILDTLYPTFLWIVGVAITLSLGKRMARGIPRSTLILQICRRAGILFALGMALYAYPEFYLSGTRIMGVLQRIAICFLAASLVY